MKKYIFLIALCAANLFLSAQNIRYVKQGAIGNGNSWATASGDIQAMIDELDDLIQQGQIQDGEVWVSEGTYIPIRPANNTSTISYNNKDNAFVLKKDVKLFGSFPNIGDPTMYDRNWVSYPAILSGDIGITNDNFDNCYHVLISAGDVGKACLDGFIVTGGNANRLDSISVNSNSVLQIYGGGIYLEKSSPTLSNLIIRNNNAFYTTGGSHGHGSGCGGGIYISNNSNSTLSNIKIHNNLSKEGGGMYIVTSSPTLDKAIIDNNTVHGYGGGVFICNNSSPMLNNTIISNNMIVNMIVNGNYVCANAYLLCASNGGGMYIDNSSPILTNVEICSNQAYINGGGAYIINSSPILNKVKIYDNRTSYSTGGGMYIKNSTCATFTNIEISGNKSNLSAIYGGHNGGGIFIENSDLDLLNVSMKENIAISGHGGGIYIKNTPTNFCNLTNVLLANNYADIQAAAIYIHSGNCEMTNVTVSGNSSSHTAPVIYCANSNSVLTINNSIVYGNYPNIMPITNNIIYNYSLIENQNPGGTNLNGYITNPQFLNSTGRNYRLNRYSPCCNAGDNNLYLTARGIANFTDETDCGGVSRLNDTAIDMGAYENYGVAHNGSGVFFVKQGANGKQNGSSWEHAFDDLSIALREIPLSSYATVKEIWVADGTYYPTGGTIYYPDTTDRAKSFTIQSPVEIYGGFPADANDAVHTSLNHRGSLALGEKKTILSGKINYNNPDTDNSYHVLTFAHSSVGVLDGFVIEGGNADGNGTFAQGGGVNVEDGHAHLHNVEIRNNTAVYGGGIALKKLPNHWRGGILELKNAFIFNNEADYGGGIYGDSVFVMQIEHSTISNNTALQNGGGLYYKTPYTANDVWEKVKISHNTAQNGGGMYIDNSNINLSSISFIHNKVANNGGGIYIDNTIGKTCNLTNCLLANDTADKGGAVFMKNGSCALTNVTITENEDTLSNLQGIYRLSPNNTH